MIRELHHELVPERGDLVQVEPGLRQVLEVAEMIGPASARMLHGQIGDVTPAVRLAGEEGDPFGVRRRAHERGKIRRQRRQGQLVDDTVAFVIPRAQGQRG
ncbi:MAG: hypothetical protein RLZZ221_2129 [Verrucomicrobiota bacterium]